MNLTSIDSSFFKDYIYPALDLLVKIVIGVGLAVLLHRRSYADKVKETLIETYLDFLDSEVKVSRGEAKRYEAKFYETLRKKVQDSDLRPEQKKRLCEALQRKAPPRDQQAVEDELEVSRFSAFTYRFCLLIGARRYRDAVGKHEAGLAKFFQADLETAAAKIFQETQCASDLKPLAHSDSEGSLDQALEPLKTAYMKAAIQHLQARHIEFTNPYSVALAKAIDKA